ncbi:hypothetical protein E8E14_014974 [Neopestalotiopsis sp. 37M]|nr:hypothetical protein E8E14_014974 [Neopestalotiopsis sp. 37M]
MKLLLETILVSLCVTSTQGLQVNTSSGYIKGHASTDHSDVEEFLGIPFGKAPIGSLRFQPPVRYESQDDFVADRYGYTCIQSPATVNASQPENWQNIARSQQEYTNYTSEDCLNLNVWTKRKQPGSCSKKLRPVLMYFYGGGFHSGSGNDPSYNGAIFAQQQDVVFVAFNYRLGIFGFSGAPGFTQNVALLDQRLAVEWVRDNIRGFGGDPSRISIFGHSAGGASVDFYDFAFYQDPIIAGVVPMSGSVNAFGRRFENTSEAGWTETAKLLNCSSNSEADTATCMENADAQTLLSASLKASNIVSSQLDTAAQLYAGITSLFGPTIDNKTVFANYTDRVAAGQLSRVPAILGFNNDEACFFTESGRLPNKAEVVLGVNEAVFACPLQWGATWRANAGIPTWKYLYEGAYPNLYAPACPGKPWHGQELYVIFNSSELATGYAATPAELAGGEYWRNALATFARNPSTGLTANSSAIQWPEFVESQGQAAVTLGGNSTFEEVAPDLEWTAPCYTPRLRYGAPNF